jgi:hypothetical protein
VIAYTAKINVTMPGTRLFSEVLGSRPAREAIIGTVQRYAAPDQPEAA